MRSKISVLSGFDLNLLTAFDALMRESQVSRAATRVGLSQSAMSHALGRLRTSFGDDLFVRSGSGIQPTTKALQLDALVGPALTSLGIAIGGERDFDASDNDRIFTIAMPDMASVIVLPELLPIIRRIAPGVSIEVFDATYEAAVEAVSSGRADIAIGAFTELPDQIESTVISRIDSVGIADAANPFLINGKMTLEDFLHAPHVITKISEAHYGIDVDQFLSSQGLRRDVRLILSHYLSVPSAIRHTDLVATIERHVWDRLDARHGLLVFDLPFERPVTYVALIWHRRMSRDPGHRWLRELAQDRLGHLASIDLP